MSIPGTPANTDQIVRRSLALDGRRVSYLWRDGGQGGPTLVFIHGSGVSARYWSDQLRALADSARVLAIDLPGHGESDDAPVPSLAAYADVTARVVDALAAWPVIEDGKRRDSGNQKVARRASAFCEHAWKACIQGLVPRQRHWRCAEHVRQLGSESLLFNLMEVKN